VAGKTLKANVIIGGSMSGAFKSALSSTRDGLKQIGEAITAVDKRQRLMAQGIEVFGRQGRNVDGLRAQYAQLTAASERLRAAQQRLAGVQQAIDANSARRAQLRGQMFDAVAAAAVFALPIKAAVNFETAMLGVAKQVQGARDDAGNLTPIYFDMARQIQSMAREVPIAANELADMAAAGARMGVAREELMGFVRTSAMMADAFELPAGQLADDMGKIAGLFGIPIPKIGELADAINYLDDNAISKGGDIIDVMRRIGGMASTLRMPATEAAALGSTFLTLGSSAEVAGTASNAVMRILGAATAQSKRVRKGFESIGLKPEDVQAGMAKNATATIMMVLDKLNSLSDEERMVATTRIFGAEYGDDLAKLAGGVEEYRRQLALANGEAAKGSMSREFEARLKTTGAQWQIMKNRLTEMGVAIGSALLPALNDLLKTVGPVVSKFADWARENPGTMKAIVGTAAALTSLRVASLAVGYAWTFVRGGWLQASALFARVQGALALASTKASVFGHIARFALGGIATLSGPVIAVVAAVAAVFGAAALVVRKYWEPISAFFVGFFQGMREAAVPIMAKMSAALAPLAPAWDAISSAMSAAWDWFMKLIVPVEMTKEELAGATEAGRTFGTNAVAVFGLVADVIGVAVGLFVKLGEAIGTTAGFLVTTFGPPLEWLRTKFGEVFDWIMSKMAPVRDGLVWLTGKTAQIGSAAGGLIDRAGQALGFGDDGAAPALAVAGGGKLPPPAPSAAGRRGGAAAGPTSNTFNITQQPGESQEQLARRIIDEQERRKGVQARGALADGND
jgi:TP901 family phage tail tape measure protein